jgi:xanthine dehydrogenase YagS FAD-binding subunit
LPPLHAARRSRYRKARERRSFAFALASLAAVLELRDGVVGDVRIALGGVAHKPWRATHAEAQLVDEPLERERLERAADAELAAARPLRQNAFKVTLVRNLIVTVLLELGARS